MKKFLTLGLVVVMAFALVLAGCGGGNQPADNSDQGQDSVSTGEDKLKIAALLPGTINDQGWNATAYRGLKLIEEQFDAEIKYTESVPQSDMEDVFRGYASQGFDVVIGHGFEFGDSALRVAPEFPDVKFIVTSTDIHQEPNVASLNTDNFEQGFLQGVVAALVTETNIVGAVGGLEIPPIVDSLAGFKVGAKYINPEVEVLTTMTGDFEDAAKAKETANALIEKGADVIMADADQAGIGAIQAAQEAGVLAIGANGDQNSLAPDTVVTSGFDDLAFAMEILMDDILAGNFVPKFYDLGVSEGAVYLSEYHSFEEKLPQEVKDKIAQIQEDLKTEKLDAHALRK